MIWLFIVIVAVVILYFSLCYYVAGTIIHLARQPVPKTPKDYGLDYEVVSFAAEDGVKLSGWLIPGNSDKLVVQTHVGGLTKYGSTLQFKGPTRLYNQEIEFMKMARHLHDAGYGVLTFDFRNHGESDPSPNRGIAGVGLEEYKDIVAAMNFIGAREDLQDKKVGFVSICMGANSTIIAMSKQPDSFRDVKCLFAIQPISMEVFIRTYTKRLFTPLGAKLILPLVKRMVVWRGGYPIEAESPKDYVKDLKVPTLYVQARNDPWTELSDIEGFFRDTPEPKEFFWIENTKHRFESYAYFGDHPAKLLEWLKKWM